MNKYIVMEKFEFKSAICTSVEQSKRLLELGLKKETADMVYVPHYKNERLYCYFDAQVLNDSISQYMFTDPSFVDYIPAWSLYRIVELIEYNTNIDAIKELLAAKEMFTNNLYTAFINIIEYLIQKGEFNKDYLEEKK